MFFLPEFHFASGTLIVQTPVKMRIAIINTINKRLRKLSEFQPDYFMNYLLIRIYY
jgi:hypothetical protein